MFDEQLALDLARAGLGVNYWVMGHAHHGWWGLLKDIQAVGRADRDIPDGPLSAELADAARIMAGKGPDLDELHVDITVSGLATVKHEGAAILAAVAPTLAGLPEDAATQVRTWLLACGERLAATSRDEFGGERVSADEAEALAALRAFLADPRGQPLSG